MNDGDPLVDSDELSCGDSFLMPGRQREKVLSISDFARLLGTTRRTLENLCGDVFASFDFHYSILEGKDLHGAVLKVLKDLEVNQFSVSGKNRKNDWERGWNENLQEFKSSDFPSATRRPKYLVKNPLKRLFQNFILPADPLFEVNFYTVYRSYVFRRLLAPYEHIFEFGCGTGHNLFLLGQLFPDKNLYGLDWAQSSVELVNEIGKKHNPHLRGVHFDFFEPDYSLNIPPNSVFVTFNSLEQVGGNHQPFLRFVNEKKPALCVNSEPFVELYDDAILLDYLAAKYHRARNYLEGYLDALKGLEVAGRIVLNKIHRVHFGSFYHEGYSLAIWSPKTV